MNKKIIIVLASFSLTFSQSIADLNSQLNKIKSDLQSNVVNKQAQSIGKVDVASKPVVISKKNNKSPNDLFFGYDYFQKDINFFDNIPTPADYKLGTGDEIVLSLWGEINSREKFVINKEGLIYFKNIGFINLSNKTIKEAEMLLTDKLAAIYSTLKDDQNTTKLMVELGKLKSLNIYFTGEVFQPGIELIHPFSDIFSALVQAGGINQKGSLRTIQLIRNKEVMTEVDFYSFFNNGIDNFSNLKLLDGDIIHVPIIKNRIQITGQVVRPGYYEVLAGEHLDDIINYAAGLKPKASSIITVDTILPVNDRTSEDNIISSINLNLKNSKNFNLNNGDIISVRSVGSSASKVEVLGRVKVPGKYSAKNMSLKDILDIAGGFNDPVFRKTINDKITVLRRDENQFYSKEFQVSYEESDTFKLSIDDKILVYEDINYRNAFTFTINGEVNKPGLYPLRKGMTVEDAIAMAGGITEMASLNNLVINQSFSSVDIDGNKVTSTERVSNASLDFEIGANTVISALPYENVINIKGNVYNPGLIAYKKGYTINTAVVKAGGYKPNSLKKLAYVIKADGEIRKNRLFFGRAERLDPGDTVVVPIDPNPNDFDITTFIADLSSTLANIVAILIIIDNQKD